MSSEDNKTLAFRITTGDENLDKELMRRYDIS